VLHVTQRESAQDAGALHKKLGQRRRLRIESGETACRIPRPDDGMETFVDFVSEGHAGRCGLVALRDGSGRVRNKQRS
jgi:hypothetical protein